MGSLGFVFAMGPSFHLFDHIVICICCIDIRICCCDMITLSRRVNSGDRASVTSGLSSDLSSFLNESNMSLGKTFEGKTDIWPQGRASSEFFWFSGPKVSLRNVEC
jgi:hypothetical protein